MAAVGGAGTGGRPPLLNMRASNVGGNADGRPVTPVVSPEAEESGNTGFLVNLSAKGAPSSRSYSNVIKEYAAERAAGIKASIGGVTATINTSSLADKEEIDPATYNIPDTEELENPAGLEGRDIFFFKDKVSGKLVRVRKVERPTGRPGQYEATLEEAKKYRKLIKEADHASHILPYLGHVVGRSGATSIIIIDFGYVNGVNFEEYLMAGLPANASVNMSQMIAPEKRAYIKSRLSADPAKKEVLRKLLIEAAKHLQWFLSVGYTHGDVKLDNFFISEETGQTYIIDFGRSNISITKQTVDADLTMLVDYCNVILPGLTVDGLSPKYFNRSAIIRQNSGEIPEQTSLRIQNNSKVYKQYGINMYQDIINQLEAAAGSMGGGRRRRPRRTRHRRTRHRRRHHRKTHKSMPRIMR